MGIYELSKQVIASGVKHTVVVCSADQVTYHKVESLDEATALQINYKSSSERAKQRKKAKQYRLKNKSKLKLKRKKYEQKMKYRKPDRKRSQTMKQVHKRYNY